MHAWLNGEISNQLTISKAKIPTTVIFVPIPQICLVGNQFVLLVSLKSRNMFLPSKSIFSRTSNAY